MTHLDIVNKLIGNIYPYGATHIDADRFENLKEMCSLVSELVSQIKDVANHNKDRYEHSMKEMGLYADNFIKNDYSI